MRRDPVVWLIRGLFISMILLFSIMVVFPRPGGKGDFVRPLTWKQDFEILSNKCGVHESDRIHSSLHKIAECVERCNP